MQQLFYSLFLQKRSTKKRLCVLTKMKGALRFVITALVCAYVYAQRDIQGGKTYTFFDGFCRDKKGGDVQMVSVNDVESKEACAYACNRDIRCNAIEWYPSTKGYLDRKCHIYTGTEGSGGDSLQQVTQGGGNNGQDPKCYVYLPGTDETD
jgi:hypothetical protein